MISRSLFIAFLLIFSTTQAVEVSITGAVNNPGTYDLGSSPRVFTALARARPTGHAYFLGAMLLRQSLLEGQLKLKAGLLYDMQVAMSNSYVNKTPSLRQSLYSLNAKIKSLAATGRKVAEFNPAILSTNLARNIPLKNFDKIFIPTRPKGVYVLGAVVKPGQYNFKSKSVVNIARKVKRNFADSDWVWLAQPDGTVEKIGVGLWNHQWEKVAAPGAIIFIPYVAKAFFGTNPHSFNQQMAEFLGTQNTSTLTTTP